MYFIKEPCINYICGDLSINKCLFFTWVFYFIVNPNMKTVNMVFQSINKCIYAYSVFFFSCSGVDCWMFPCRSLNVCCSLAATWRKYSKMTRDEERSTLKQLLAKCQRKLIWSCQIYWQLVLFVCLYSFIMLEVFRVLFPLESRKYVKDIH